MKSASPAASISQLVLLTIKSPSPVLTVKSASLVVKVLSESVANIASKSSETALLVIAASKSSKISCTLVAFVLSNSSKAPIKPAPEAPLVVSFNPVVPITISPPVVVMSPEPVNVVNPLAAPAELISHVLVLIVTSVPSLLITLDSTHSPAVLSQRRVFPSLVPTAGLLSADFH